MDFCDYCFSSGDVVSNEFGQNKRTGNPYAGSIEAIVLPLEDGTTSPLMKRPSGCSYCCPLGVVIFLKRDMVMNEQVCLSDGTLCSPR